MLALQHAAQPDFDGRATALVANALHGVAYVASVRHEHILESRKAAEGQRSFLCGAGRRELETVDDRLVRHKGADDIIARIPSSKQSDGSAPAARARFHLSLPRRVARAARRPLRYRPAAGGRTSARQ